MTAASPEFDRAVAQGLAHHTVGLVKMSEDGLAASSLAGSGTLVSVGPMSGLLTAAHVVKCLGNKGQVGFVHFDGRGQVHKPVIDLAVLERLTICGETFGPNGPDLAFLRLPLSTVATLQARSNFLNLLAQGDTARCPEPPADTLMTAVVGVVGEWTENLRHKSFESIKRFTLLAAGGRIASKREHNGHDLLDFERVLPKDQLVPSSYGGVSGGGLWRVYVCQSEQIIETRLLGFAFYQSPLSEGSRLITCHGPRSVYGHLIDAMTKKWPEIVEPPAPPRRGEDPQ